MSVALSRMMKVTASTKRSPALAGGLRSEPVEYLTGVKCLPVDPVSISETRERMLRMGLETPVTLLQTLVSGSLDIQAGDLLVVGSTEYPIRDVEPWAESSLGGDAYKRLVVEDVT